MQIVIEISDHLYKCLQKRIELNVSSEVDQIIAKGTPLPEHYGVLIDTTNLITKIQLATGCSFLTAQEIINKSVVIVPATKEGDGE